jgi:hypothetical protein
VRQARPLIALAAALAVGGWLLASRPAQHAVPPQKQPAAAQTFAIKPGVATAKLPDGAAYTPMFYSDATTSVGTAVTPDGTADRLVLRMPGGDRELRRIEQNRFTQFLAFTTADGMLYWAESSATPSGPYETRMWRAPSDGSAAAASLTADTGAAVFFDSEFDLVVAEGRLHWIAAPPDDAPRTELRSVAVTGGAVTVQPFEGRFRHTAWPWLESVDSQGPLLLADPRTGARRTVTRSAAESVVCTPVWCRSMVPTGTGSNLFDVMHPDGTARRRVPGDLTAVSVDAAIGGRYELFTDVLDDQVRLLAYDLDTGDQRVLATDVGVVTARAGMVWWSDRPQDPSEWRSADLRA